jgi:predicted transcriptional regulator
MTKLQTAIFLIKNGYITTDYVNGNFAAKLTPKGKQALNAYVMIEDLLK